MRRGTIGFANNHKIWRDTFIYDQGKLSSKKLDYGIVMTMVVLRFFI